MGYHQGIFLSLKCRNYPILLELLRDYICIVEGIIGENYHLLRKKQQQQQVLYFNVNTL